MDNKEKEIVLTVSDDLHARLKIALFYDRLGQSQFIRYIITGYLDNNIHLRAFMDEVLAKDLSVRKRWNRKKDTIEADNTIKNFALDDSEIENIFDILENEEKDI